MTPQQLTPTLFHMGPPLDMGPLPSLFYFALSATDSLTKDPFNQVVTFLQGKPIRIFSLTLPGHEAPFTPQEGIRIWAEDTKKGKDPLPQFFDEADRAIQFGIEKGFIDKAHLSVAGLSRGGLIALHVAARNPSCNKICLFSPVIRLSQVQEFLSCNAASWDAPELSSLLCTRRLLLQIGNRDTRVQTRNSTEFVLQLVEEAHKQGIRSPPLELHLYPSVGQHGHGTPPEIFAKGAAWIASS